jgi:hypothetical protein
MKKRIIGSVIIFVVGLFAPQIICAQGTITFLSNLTQPSAGGVALGSNSWVAPLFYSGNNVGGYVLNSIQLAMTDASGNPGGFTVMLYSGADIFGAIRPASSLGTLTGQANPTTAGIYTYTAPSGLTLSSGTPYFIVLTAGTGVATGAYEWSLSGIDSYNPTGGWGVTGPDADVWESTGGSSWNSISGTNPQFAINATATPEPGVIGLFALGGLLIASQRRKASLVE